MRRATIVTTAAVLATAGLVAGSALEAEAASISSCGVSSGRTSCTSGGVYTSDLIAIGISGGLVKGSLVGVSWRVFNTSTGSNVASGKITSTWCSMGWSTRGRKGTFAVQIWNARSGTGATISNSALASTAGCIG